MSDNRRMNKTHRIGVRLSEKEHEQIRQRAEELGLAVSAWFRMIARKAVQRKNKSD